MRFPSRDFLVKGATSPKFGERGDARSGLGSLVNTGSLSFGILAKCQSTAGWSATEQ